MVLDECDTMLESMAQTRDKAIQATDKVETERDEARGKLLFVLPRLSDVEDENERLRLQIDKQPSRLVWAGVGAGAALVVGGVAVYLLSAL